jgi:ATP-binding cassette subfamily F protein 3
VHIYPGNYEDYLWRKQGGPAQVAVSLATSLKPAPSAPPNNAVILSEGAAEVEGPAVNGTAANAAAVRAPVKRLNPIKLKQLEDRVAAIEQELAMIDSRVAAAEESLGHYSSAEESQRTAAELDILRDQRAALLAEWEELATSLEEQSTAV